MLQKIIFQINAVLIDFLYIIDSRKKIIKVSMKIWNSITVVNTDYNDKRFLRSKSVY